MHPQLSSVSVKETCPAFGLGDLEDMMIIADPVCFGSFDLSMNPTQFFELTFAKNHEKFISDLNSMTRQTVSHVTVSDWTDLGWKVNETEKISSFKKRRVTLTRRNISPWSWMNNKPTESSLDQYCVHNPKGWTVYVISQGFERRSIRVIEKYDVQVLAGPSLTNEVREPDVEKNEHSHHLIRVVAWASAHYADGSPPSFVAFTKATSSCRFQYGKWKQLVLEQANASAISHPLNRSHSLLTGVWNKLGSCDLITLSAVENRIIHQDGHSFPFSVTNHTDTMTVIESKYGERVFAGKIVHSTPDELKWSNGSVWIKDGFRRFVGTYAAGNERMQFRESGEIVSSDGTKINVILCGRSEIERMTNTRTRRFAEFVESDDKKLIWNNDTVWTRIDDEDLSSASESDSPGSSTDEEKEKEQEHAVHKRPKAPTSAAPTAPSKSTSKSPSYPAPSPSIKAEKREETKAKEETESVELIAGSKMCQVLELEGLASDDDEPSVSASYSMSVEKITRHDLEKIDEFEDWLVIDETLT